MPLSDCGDVNIRGPDASFEEQPAMRKENKRNLMTEVISKPAERLSLNSLSFPRTYLICYILAIWLALVKKFFPVRA